MKHWTKIRRDIVRSTRMAALLETNALAYGLYLNAKAVSDDYGRIVADPRKFKALAAPMSDIPLSDVSAALDCMETCAVVRRYQVNGDLYLEILEYNTIEGTDWVNVGQPDYPCPEGWTPPADLVEFIVARGSTDKRIKPSRYGLTPEQVPGYHPPPAKKGGKVGRPSGERRPRAVRLSSEPQPTVEGGSVPSASASSSVSEVESRKAVSEGNPADFNHMEACGDPFIAEFTAYLAKLVPVQKAQDWSCDLHRRVCAEGSGLTEAEVLAALRDGNPPRGKEQSFTENYLDRLVKEKARGSAAGDSPQRQKFGELLGRHNPGDLVWEDMFRRWQQDPTASEVLAYLAEGQRRQEEKPKRLEAGG